MPFILSCEARKSIFHEWGNLNIFYIVWIKNTVDPSIMWLHHKPADLRIHCFYFKNGIQIWQLYVNKK